MSFFSPLASRPLESLPSCAVVELLLSQSQGNWKRLLPCLVPTADSVAAALPAGLVHGRPPESAAGAHHRAAVGWPRLRRRPAAGLHLQGGFGSQGWRVRWPTRAKCNATASCALVGGQQLHVNSILHCIIKCNAKHNKCKPGKRLLTRQSTTEVLQTCRWRSEQQLCGPITTGGMN